MAASSHQDATAPEAVIAQRLIAMISAEYGFDPREIDIDAAFTEFGISSIGVISLIRELEEWLELTLSPTLAWDYPSIRALSEHLAHNEAAAPQTTPLADTTPASAQPSPNRHEPIAIIGMACRFPGAANLEAFWELLYAGEDAVGEIPAERWNSSEYFHPVPGTPGKMVTRWGGFVEDIDHFDAAFFGISPREASHLDPRQRLLCETAWEALEHAGIPTHALAGSNTGVFIASLKDEYSDQIFAHPTIVDAYTGTGNAASVLANRLSYLFDLHGPSLAIDTACSGSLVAIHLACQSLRAGESSLALVGGVNVILKPDANLFFSKAGALAPDGRCKTFDARANGMVRSEGAGMIVLKPLAAAQADGDRIIAVVRGSAVNQDGRTNGLMAPSGKAQEQVIRQACRAANIAPAALQYIEAHGTGTKLGDPIEVQSIGAVVREGRDPQRPCLIGSVKTNVGHLEAAAGMAGVIKVALSLKQRILPASLHFQHPNPLIPFESMPVRVHSKLGAWPYPDEPLLAGVSGFGFGGTNGHVILEEAPEQLEPAAVADERSYLLTLSARSPEALRQRVQDYHWWLHHHTSVSLRDICYTASVRRSHLDYRLALPVRSREGAVEALLACLSDPRCLEEAGRPRNEAAALVWVCGPEIGQLPQLESTLLADPTLQGSLEASATLALQRWGFDLRERLLAPQTLTSSAESQLVQVALQIALGHYWRSVGAVPSQIIGVGLGEISAAHLAGALSLGDALSLAWVRGTLTGELGSSGAAASVGLNADQARLAITAFEDELTVGSSLGPTTTVITGDPAALDRVVRSLERRGVVCERLGSAGALHRPAISEALVERGDLVRGIAGQAPQLPLWLASASGLVHEPLDGSTWLRLWSQELALSTVIEAAEARGGTLFLEIGATPALREAMASTLAQSGRGRLALSSLETPSQTALLGAIAKLYSAGIAIDWARLYETPGKVVALPLYPWQRERYWIELPQQQAAKTPSSSANHPVLGFTYHSSALDGLHIWMTEVDPARMPRLPFASDAPGAPWWSLAGMLLDFVQEAANDQLIGDAVTLTDIHFNLPHGQAAPGPQLVQVQLSCTDDRHATFAIFSMPLVAGQTLGGWSELVRGTALPDLSVAPPLTFDELRKRCSQPTPTATTTAPEAWWSEREALGHMTWEAAANEGPRTHMVALPLLYQVAQAQKAATGEAPLPGGVARLHITAPLTNDAWYHVAWHDPDGPGGRQADLCLFNNDGQPVVVIEGLQFV